MSTVISNGTIITHDLTFTADVRSEGGKIFSITPDWAEKGANVLLHAVLEAAEVAG